MNDSERAAYRQRWIKGDLRPGMTQHQVNLRNPYKPGSANHKAYDRGYRDAERGEK
jgi:hypothetical protein